MNNKGGYSILLLLMAELLIHCCINSSFIVYSITFPILYCETYVLIHL